MARFPVQASALAVMAVLMTGCASGGGDETTRNAYDSYIAQLSDLRSDLGTLSPLDVSELPTSGSASYTGVVGFGVRMEQATDTSMAGAMELSVDFGGSGDITGRIHDVAANELRLTGEDIGPVEGELRIVNGTIERNPIDPRFDPHFTADVEGTLTDDLGPLVFDATIDGRFVGEDAQMIDGDINGRAGPEPAVMDRVTGSFVLVAE